MGDEQPGDDVEPAGGTLSGRAASGYPGQLDERLLTPSAPLAPGAGIRMGPTALVPQERSSSPARWAPDPTGRHQWRWWGGMAWTDHVADDGVAAEDPLHPA